MDGDRMTYTKEEALQRARRYGLEREVRLAMQHGCTPDEALQDWDLFPYEKINDRR